MEIFIGHLETEHFKFTTYAETPIQASVLMRNAWKIHQKNTGAWLTWRELKPSVYIEAVILGTHTIH